MSSRILMCRPDYFKVSYAINPWMKSVKPVDRSLAHKQWLSLKKTLESCGAKVDVMQGAEGVPDMVFTANAALIRGKKAYLASFKFEERQKERSFYKKWFEAHGYEADGSVSIPFEGAGDALFTSPNTLFAAYGFRTDKQVYSSVQEHLGDIPTVVHCKLIDEHFYHLDTAFCPINDKLAIWYPWAFCDESRKRMENHVELLEVPKKDADRFACNMVVVGQKAVFNAGNDETAKILEKRGIETHQVNVSEFIKAGGACKCLTLAV